MFAAAVTRVLFGVLLLTVYSAYHGTRHVR